MNELTRWNQCQEMENLHRKMSSLLNRNGLSDEDENISFPDWSPLVDIAEDDREYLIKVELPEVRKEDVKVTVEAGTLTIAGGRRVEKKKKAGDITGSNANMDVLNGTLIFLKMRSLET